MCLCGYEVNVETPVCDFEPYFVQWTSKEDRGYMIPFGDGPKPLFDQQIAKTMIMNMLNQATDYVYMMSPYNTALPILNVTPIYPTIHNPNIYDTFFFLSNSLNLNTSISPTYISAGAATYEAIDVNNGAKKRQNKKTVQRR